MTCLLLGGLLQAVQVPVGIEIHSVSLVRSAGICGKDFNWVVKNAPSLFSTPGDALPELELAAGALYAGRSVSVAMVNDFPICCVGSSADLSSMSYRQPYQDVSDPHEG